MSLKGLGQGRHWSWGYMTGLPALLAKDVKGKLGNRGGERVGHARDLEEVRKLALSILPNPPLGLGLTV